MKKKIFMLAVAACLVVLSIAGSSLAYFTDTDEKTTVFTAGNVDIKLSFTAPEGNAYPNQAISAPADITNVGSEDAYVGAIITFTAGADKNLATIISPEGDADDIPVSIRKLLVGLVSTDCVIKYTTTQVDGKTTEYKVYVLMDNVVAKESGTVTLFEGVKIPYQWNNAEMAVFNQLNISVKAYATQTKGFTTDGTDTAETALTTAFPDWTGFSGYDTLA